CGWRRRRASAPARRVGRSTPVPRGPSELPQPQQRVEEADESRLEPPDCVEIPGSSGRTRNVLGYDGGGKCVTGNVSNQLWLGVLARCSTALPMRCAAFTTDACSQNRRTFQPALRSLRSVSRSRSTLAASFARHHLAFAFGYVPRVGQQCQ